MMLCGPGQILSLLRAWLLSCKMGEWKGGFQASWGLQIQGASGLKGQCRGRLEAQALLHNLSSLLLFMKADFKII